MSNVAELAELEAAIAEAELADDEAREVRSEVENGRDLADAIDERVRARAETPPPPGPPPPPEPEPTEPTDKQLAQLDREQARHEARVNEIMGAFVAGFAPCSECAGVGLAPPGPRPQAHPWFKACETCEGFGQVRTGSLRPGNESRDCPECRGRGYLEALSENGTPLADGGPAAPAGVTAPAPPIPPPASPATNGAPAATNFGVPAWMGDPALGQ